MQNDYNKLSVLAVISFLFLLSLAYFNHIPGQDKDFGPDNFYVGAVANKSDPKEMYKSLSSTITVDTSNDCNLSIMSISSEEEVLVNNGLLWLATNSSDTNEDDWISYFESIKFEETNSVQPYKNGNKKIVAPTRIKFTNSNYTGNAYSPNIEFKVGNYYFVIENATNWWCHYGKDNAKSHTEEVGANTSRYSTANRGQVIGEANAETTVTVYLVDEKGNRSEESVPLTEFYGLSGN